MVIFIGSQDFVNVLGPNKLNDIFDIFRTHILNNFLFFDQTILLSQQVLDKKYWKNTEEYSLVF